jgi:protein-S-isoprenylcysteine O-methyltransferase Ste14
MFVEKIVDFFLLESGKERSLRYKIAVLALGALIFLLVFPGVLFVAGWALDKYFMAERLELLGMVFAITCGCVGLFLMAWTLITQAVTGRGTPVPVAPPQKLIVTGPYKLCRNPMILGAILYYLGVGIYFGSLEIGLVMLLLTWKIGSAYVKFIEEKELERRFGEEYEEYRKETPFLIPRLWK